MNKLSKMALVFVAVGVPVFATPACTSGTVEFYETTFGSGDSGASHCSVQVTSLITSTDCA